MLYLIEKFNSELTRWFYEKSIFLTEDVQGSNLTQARLKLYQAGIGSSSISDEQLLKYWDEAKKEKINFVKYVQDRL